MTIIQLFVQDQKQLIYTHTNKSKSNQIKRQHYSQQDSYTYQTQQYRKLTTLFIDIFQYFSICKLKTQHKKIQFVMTH